MDSDSYFWYNTETGESSWGKPKLLGKAGDIEPTPRGESIAVATGREPAPKAKRARAKDHAWTDEEAATALQGMWRRRHARLARRDCPGREVRVL